MPEHRQVPAGLCTRVCGGVCTPPGCQVWEVVLVVTTGSWAQCSPLVPQRKQGGLGKRCRLRLPPESTCPSERCFVPPKLNVPKARNKSLEKPASLMTWHPGICQQGCRVTLPSEPCGFPPPAPNPPLLGAHPWRAVTCLIALFLHVAGPRGTARPIPPHSKPSLMMQVLHVGPYPLHVGSLGHEQRETHVQVPPSPSMTRSRGAVLATGAAPGAPAGL